VSLGTEGRVIVKSSHLTTITLHHENYVKYCTTIMLQLV